MPIQAYLWVLICVASLIPFLYLGIDGIPLYTDVRELEVLTTTFQGRRFLQGLEIASIMVCTVFTIPQKYIITRTHLALACYWFYLVFFDPLPEDASCWTKTRGHRNRRSCHSCPTTICRHLPARIYASFRFGLPICCDMAKYHCRVEFLPGRWQSAFSC